MLSKKINVERQLGKVTINQFYNQKFRKFLCYCWVQSFIIRRYNLNNHKRGRFHLAKRNHNLLYMCITYIETTHHNSIWDDFEQFYALITSSQQLATYAF